MKRSARSYAYAAARAANKALGTPGEPEYRRPVELETSPPVVITAAMIAAMASEDDEFLAWRETEARSGMFR